MDPQSPREAWQRIQSALKTQGARGGGFPGAGGRPTKGLLGGFGGLVLLGGLYLTANNALFNGMPHGRNKLILLSANNVPCVNIVDGGHRAIKYTRMGGIKNEIFAEGINALPS